MISNVVAQPQENEPLRKEMRTDNGGEFQKEFTQLMAKRGIAHTFSLFMLPLLLACFELCKAGRLDSSVMEVPFLAPPPALLNP